MDEQPLSANVAFPPVRVSHFFAAQGAFILVDAGRMPRSDGEAGFGANLLKGSGPFVLSEKQFRAGVMLPALGVELGYYSVIVCQAGTEGAIPPLSHMVYSPGFVLGTETGDLLLCNADRLMDWRPGANPDPGERFPLSSFERPVHIPPGLYAATVVAGIAESETTGGEEWICAFLLERTDTQPEFFADLNRPLSFFGS